MTSQRTQGVAEVLLAQEQLTHSLGRLFAEAFAVYTVEVLARLTGAKTGTDEPHSLAESLSSAETILESAPAWIRQAFEESRQKDTPSQTAPDLRPRVARNKLLLALRERGWTQADLARRMKKSPTVVSRIFRTPERSRIKTLQEVAAALGVDLSDLLRPLS